MPEGPLERVLRVALSGLPLGLGCRRHFRIVTGFTCGALIPHGDLYAVVGWDGQPITHVHNVRVGLDAVRSFYATMAIGSAEPAASLRY